MVHNSRTSVAGSLAGSVLSVDMFNNEEDNLGSVPSWSSKIIWYLVPSIILLAALVLGSFFLRPIDLSMQTTTIPPQIVQASRSTETVKPQPAQTAHSVYKDPKEDLFTAAAAGSLQDVSNLLKLGVKPSIRDPKLWSPLHFAAANGRKEIINILFEIQRYRLICGW